MEAFDGYYKGARSAPGALECSDATGVVLDRHDILERTVSDWNLFILLFAGVQALVLCASEFLDSEVIRLNRNP